MKVRKMIRSLVSVLFFAVVRLALAASAIEPVVDQQYFPLMKSLLAGAQERIGVLHLTLHPTGWMSRAILKELVAASRRGVAVTVVLEGHVSWAAEKNRLVARLLRKAGARVFFSSPGKLLHAKLIVVDGDKALLGSTNLSNNSMANNNEANVLLRSRAAASSLWRYISSVAERPEEDSTIVVPLEDNVTEVLTDRAFVDAAVAVMGGAREELRVSTYLFAVRDGAPGNGATRLFTALACAARRGVKVRIFLEESNFAEHVNDAAHNSLNWLKGSGDIEARFDSPTRITHSKLIIADPHLPQACRLVVGSTNWYRRGIDEAHQVNVRTSDPELVRAFTVYFDRCFELAFPAEASID